MSLSDYLVYKQHKEIKIIATVMTFLEMKSTVRKKNANHLTYSNLLGISGSPLEQQ